MRPSGIALAVAALGGLVGLAFLPRYVNAYHLSLAISLLQFTVLATAWGMFSGPTRYVSLATAAFFGVGAYTVAVLGEVLAWPLVLAIAAAIGGAMAAIVGLSTLRLSGVHFVIFTFGLAELVRQLVVWYEVNKTRVLGRYVFVDITQNDIYWQLLVLAVAVFAIGWMIARSRLGFALRIIGEDETVAQHCGINVTTAKVALFTISAVRHDPGRRDHVAALDVYRAVDCVQRNRLLSGGDHGAARRCAPAVGAGARRGAADIAVRVPVGAVSKHLDAGDGRGFSVDRVCAAVRGSRFVGPDHLAACIANDAEGGDMTQAVASSPVLEAAALTRAFGGLVAVNAIDLTVRQGEIVGLLGPNGSGKTTALNLMSGLLRPDSGTIRFAGKDIAGLPAYRIARLGLARTFQLVRVLGGMSCADNVRAGLAFHRAPLRIRRDEGCRGHAAGTGWPRRAKRAARVRTHLYRSEAS